MFVGQTFDVHFVITRRRIPALEPGFLRGQAMIHVPTRWFVGWELCVQVRYYGWKRCLAKRLYGWFFSQRLWLSWYWIFEYLWRILRWRIPDADQGSMFRRDGLFDVFSLLGSLAIFCLFWPESGECPFSNQLPPAMLFVAFFLQCHNRYAVVQLTKEAS